VAREARSKDVNSNSPWAFVLTAAFPTITILLGILVNNGRFNDLSKRIDDLSGRINDVNTGLSKRIDDLSANMVQHRNQIHSDIQMLIG
jgi:tetrahydromethanopterin S-methyltransferase subunit G